MQNEGALAIGTQVSAKYKGAFCEAKVRSVERLVKVRVVFKHGLGSTTLGERDVAADGPLLVGANVRARHPDKLEFLDAVVKEIKDQSRYTVTFNDGDIATLRRNALCMKSGKHFNASESLDNLPLTHPEHFGAPVGGARRRTGKLASGNETDDDDSSSDGEEVPSFYLTNIGRVVWAENTDKKSKSKDSWFPALIVAPSASDTVKIDTKEEFLIRSFKDGRYYTVSKKDTNKFHKDSARKPDKENMKEAVEKAVTFLERDELPPHWDRDILFNMADDSTTESSESEELDEDDDAESPEEKDRLVAELYKHMEDRGQPINKNPTIDGREVDLYRLFKLVYKAGGQVRVTNKNMWQQVAKRLGFETTWCVNQVRVHYNRYLKSFEQLNRTLGCTMKMTHPKSGGRTQIRGIHRSGGSGHSKEPVSPAIFAAATPSPVMGQFVPPGELDKPEENSDASVKEKEIKSAVASNSPKIKAEPVKEKETQNQIKQEKTMDEPEAPDLPVPLVPVETTPRKAGRSKLSKTAEKQTKRKKSAPKVTKKDVLVEPQENVIEETASSIVPPSTPASVKTLKKRISNTASITIEKDVNSVVKPKAEEITTSQMQEKKDAIKDIINKSAFVLVDRSDVVEKEVRKLQHHSYGEQTSSNLSISLSASASLNAEESLNERRGRKKAKIASRDPSESADLDCFPEDHQYLSDKIGIGVGDKIKVFYKRDIIYDAKVVKVQQKEGEKWPKFYVHYQGWNARYDEWITRSRIAEKLSCKEKLKKNEINGGEEPKEESVEIVDQVSGDLNKKSNESPTPIKGVKKSANTRGKLPPNLPKVERARSLTPTSAKKGANSASPLNKRQLVRSTSLKKEESDQDDCDETRKSSRIVKTRPTPEKRRKGRPRIHPEKLEEEKILESNDEGDADDEEKRSALSSLGKTAKKKLRKMPESSKSAQIQNKKELEDKKATKRTPMGRKKRPPTPVKEEDDDPYTFKEISEDGLSRKSPGRPGRRPKIVPKQEEKSYNSDDSSKKGDLSEMSDSILNKEKDSTDDESKKFLDDVKVEPSSDDDEETIQIERVDTPPPSIVPVIAIEGKMMDVEQGPKNFDLKIAETITLGEVDLQTEGQPVLQLSKIQKELFPNLASIRTTSPSFPRSTTPTKPFTASSKSLDSSDASLDVKESNICNSFIEEPVSDKATDLISTVSSPPPLLEGISAQLAKSSVLVPISSSQVNQPNSSKEPETVAAHISSSMDPSQSQPCKSLPQGGSLRLSGSVHLAERSEVEIVGMSDEDEEILDRAETKQPQLIPSTQLIVQNELIRRTQPNFGLSSNLRKQRKPPKKPNSSELVESDSDSGNELDKPFIYPSQKLAVEAKISETSTPKSINKRKDPPEYSDDEEPLVFKSQMSDKKNLFLQSKRPNKKESQEEDNLDLVCAEIIPCSPVHSLLPSATPNGQPTPPFSESETHFSQEGPKVLPPNGMEMPFASRPSSSAEVEMKLEAEKEVTQGAIKDDTTDEEETVSPTTATSLSSESPREFTNERSKSPTESSEIDLDSLNGQHKAGGYDVESERRRPFGHKRKPPQSPVENRSPLHSKRKRRVREPQSNTSRTRGLRGRNSDYFRGNDDDLDEDDRPRTEGDHTSLTLLDNEELLALTQRPTRKYNFFVDYDPAMESSQRVILIQNSIKELQKTYKNLKSGLAMIERRRKKIRRKERERAEKGLSGNSADGSS